MFAASKTDSASTGGYQISRSLRFNSADSANLNRTFASAGNRRTFTLSFWLKRSRVGVDYEGFFASGNGTDQIRFENIDQLRFSLNSTASGDFVTTQVFRDVAAWYHIVFAVDTTQATSTNRVKIYVNGSQITSFTTASYPTLNYDCNFNSNVSHRLGIANDTSYPFNGYMTETYLIDGQALTPSSFGETNAQTGVWQPKAYSGSYGTNGFYLNFSDNSNTTAATLGKDYSGNGNNWTPNNFSVTAGAGNDSLVDSPTSYGTTDTGVGGEIRGNYCTLNPLINTSGYATLSNGNLDVVPDSTHYPMIPATFGMTTGKWYWEYTLGASGNGGRLLGIVNGSASTTTFVGGNANGWGYYGGGQKYTNGSGTAYGASYTSGDIIGVSFDADAGTLVFYKNGTSQGTAFSSLTSGPYFPAWSAGDAGQTGTTSLNFGQRPFAYTAPSGFKALCTQNLPTPTIGATSTTTADKYFGISLYTGNGTSQSITNSGSMQPDWVWVKARNSALSNSLYDSVRGVRDTLATNITNAENLESAGFSLTAFNSNGFSVGLDNAGYGSVNGISNTYVAWQWKANGSGSTNTAGSITSTVSANTTSGFSVVTYTGTGANATVGHGLGAVPSIIIVKVRNTTDGWFVYNKEIGNTKYLRLNTTDAAATFNLWQSTSPTSSVFSIATDPTVNGSGNTYVAYCFAEVAGYSKFGSYTGNASTDGPFVYCGFRPAYIMVKGTAASGYNWLVFDSARDTYNLSVYKLYPNLSDAESGNNTTATVDIVSNGFKIRSSNNQINDNYLSGQYIFMAFASNPFKYSLAR